MLNLSVVLFNLKLNFLSKYFFLFIFLSYYFHYILVCFLYIWYKFDFFKLNYFVFCFCENASFKFTIILTIYVHFVKSMLIYITDNSSSLLISIWYYLFLYVSGVGVFYQIAWFKSSFVKWLRSVEFCFNQLRLVTKALMQQPCNIFKALLLLMSFSLVISNNNTKMLTK